MSRPSWRVPGSAESAEFAEPPAGPGPAHRGTFTADRRHRANPRGPGRSIGTATAPKGGNGTVNGQGDTRPSGTVYLPKAEVSFAGGAPADPVSTAIVAESVTAADDSAFGRYELSPIVDNPRPLSVTVAE